MRWGFDRGGVVGVGWGMGAMYQEDWVCAWRDVDDIVTALQASGLYVERVVEGDGKGVAGRRAPEALEAQRLKPGEDLVYDVCLKPQMAGAGRERRSRAMVVVAFSRNLQDEAEVMLMASQPRLAERPERVDEVALAGQADLVDAVARVLRAAGGREVPGRQPEPRLPPVTYMDTGGRNGMKYESVALVSVGAGWLAGNLLWWASRALGAPQTTDACWLAGIGGLVLTWAWLGRRPAGRKD